MHDIVTVIAAVVIPQLIAVAAFEGWRLVRGPDRRAALAAEEVRR